MRQLIAIVIIMLVEAGAVVGATSMLLVSSQTVMASDRP
jgi:hypothetical protein